MIPRKFEYYRAKSVEDAIEFLSTHEGAKVIAGGQSLVPLMKLRIVSPAYLVDIGRIEELRYIRIGDKGELRIGALTTHAEIEESELIRERWPVLAETAENIADVQIRSRGTIGGSLCHADPAADYPPTLIVLNSEVVIRGKEGRRTVPVEDFILGPFTTSIEENEILEEVIIPPYNGKAGFTKFARREGDLAVVNAAVLLKVGNGKVEDIKVAVGGVGPKPIRLKALEDRVKGGVIEEGKLSSAIDEAVKELEPPTDVHGTSEYRREVTKVILKRLILDLYRR